MSDAANSTRLFVLTKSRLDTEKKNNQNLKKRCDLIAKNLTLQIETQKKSLAGLKNEKVKLMTLLDALNRKYASMKSNFEQSKEEVTACINIY